MISTAATNEASVTDSSEAKRQEAAGTNAEKRQEAASTDGPDLVPARMLNEFAYCPRLCYLEWVQGEFVHNLDTLEGWFGHRRVDEPTRGEVPTPVGGDGKETSGPHPDPLPEGEGVRFGERRVRKLLPARDDALPLYVQEQGASVGKSGDRVTVKEKGKLIQSVRLIDESQVSLFGNVSVSAQALRELSARGVPVCHFSYGGWLNAITAGLIHKNVELRIRQFAVAADVARSLRLARQFVVGKIKNCRTLLRRHLPEDREPLLGQLAELAEEAGRSPCAESLLGTEGMAAKLYFAGFARLLKGGEAFDIEGRNRRPPEGGTPTEKTPTPTLPVKRGGRFSPPALRHGF